MSLFTPPWFAQRPMVRRSRQIAAVFTAHGLASFLGPGGFRPPFRRRGVPEAPRPTQAEHLRLAFGELGVTFVKLGQMLSTRADLLPPDFVTELAKLQDAAPPVSWESVHRTVVEELGSPPGARFARFEETPMASASIGQVHAATLHDGTEVVVKVRRPGVAEEVEIDLELMSAAARWAREHTAFGRDFDLPGITEEFSYTIRRELDYLREAQNAERFRRLFQDDPRVHVPRVFRELTTTRVLTLERMGGIKIADTHELERAGISARRVAENAIHLFIRQVLEFGIFHADPHPGNFFVQPDGSVALLDYGMIGRVSDAMQHHLLRAGLAATRFDSEALADELYALGIAGRGARHAIFVRDLDHVLHRYTGSSIGDISATQVVNEVTLLAYRHRLQLPSDLALLLRVIVMSDGLGLRLDPDFKFLDYTAPLIQARWRVRHGPGVMLRKLGRSAAEGLELGVEMPARLARLMGRLERGQLEMNVTHEGLGPIVREFQHMLNRLSISVLLAASIIALGLALAIGRPAGWPRFTGWMIAIAFPLTLALGLWLVASIWRSGRK